MLDFKSLQVCMMLWESTSQALHAPISIARGSQVLPGVNELASQKVHVVSVTWKPQDLSRVEAQPQRKYSHPCPDSELCRRG